MLTGFVVGALGLVAWIVYRRQRSNRILLEARKRRETRRPSPVDVADPDISAVALACLLVSREGEMSAQSVTRLVSGTARLFNISAAAAERLVRKGQWLALISGPEDQAVPKLLATASGAAIKGGIPALEKLAHEALEQDDTAAQHNFNRRAGWLRSARQRLDAMPAA
ncbi:MAG: hypothetical protein AAFQ33_06125 [Pseudomonadota bacterium]